MAAPMLPSKEEVQALVQSLNDAAANYEDSTTNQGIVARNRIITRAKDLVNAVRNPFDTVDAQVANANELVAIRTCLHLKALHAIPYPGTATLEQIAQTTSATPQLLERLLRLLVCTGFLISPEAHQYAHTKHSHAFTMVPGPGMFFQLIYDESFLMIANLHMYLSEKGYKEPLDERYSPYAWNSKQEGTPIYDIMAQHPQRLHAFQAGLAHADASIPLLGYYDFGQLSEDGGDPERTVFVDVGGGAGHVISQILGAYPQLDPSKFVLQDLAPVLKKASENQRLPEQVQRMQHNFFTQQPVQGAKAYFLRRILHDFSDPFAVDILTNLVPAMSHDSRILIADLMLPEQVTPNELGLASFDITMFNMGGKQRTEACFKQILDDAGCELVKIWKSESGFGVIVEARLKGTQERAVDGPVAQGTATFAVATQSETSNISTTDDTDDSESPIPEHTNGHAKGIQRELSDTTQTSTNGTSHETENGEKQQLNGHRHRIAQRSDDPVETQPVTATQDQPTAEGTPPASGLSNPVEAVTQSEDSNEANTTATNQAGIHNPSEPAHTSSSEPAIDPSTTHGKTNGIAEREKDFNGIEVYGTEKEQNSTAGVETTAPANVADS